MNSNLIENNRSSEISCLDFLIIHGNFGIIELDESYLLYELEPAILFYYKPNISKTNFRFNLYKNRLIMVSENSFIPIFYYRGNGSEILTLDYSNLFKLNLSLTLDEQGIQEFALFHTTLNEGTFHCEVKRLFGVTNIVLNQNKISIKYQEKKYCVKPVKELFNDRIKNFMVEYNDARHATLLSGGGESRINAAIASAFGLSKKFFTWGHPQDKEYLIAHKIAKRLNIDLENIRPDSHSLCFNEFLNKVGFLTNMVSTYRYEVIKQLFEYFNIEVVWSGLGDINGYPVRYHPSELFSSYYLGLYNGEKRYPPGWNLEWLREYETEGNEIVQRVYANPTSRTFFDLNQEVFSPRIFGQIFAAENTLGFVISPWFNPDIYEAVHNEELENPKIIESKIFRTIWKNELYYRLVNKYCPELNFIKNAKGYYPWMVRKSFGLPGLFFAAILKKWASRKRYPFDPVEDKNFIKNELEKIIDEGNEIFDKDSIKNIIQKQEQWKGPDISEYFKLIQIHWFFKMSQS